MRQKIRSIYHRYQEKWLHRIKSLFRSSFKKEVSELLASGLFDSEWYGRTNPDVASENFTPVEHYVRSGWKEGRDPSPLFANNWYLEQYPDVAKHGQNPLTHYLRLGVFEGRDPHPLFDSDWYLEQNPDVAEHGQNPLTHYLQLGGFEGRDPHPLFDSDWYLEQNPDIAQVGLNPLIHWLSQGWKEGRSPSPLPLFDTAWYLARYPDLDKSGLNPLVHWLIAGWRERRDPSPHFNTKWYFDQHPNIEQANINPLLHFIRLGALEGHSIEDLAKKLIFQPNQDIATEIRAGIDFSSRFQISLDEESESSLFTAAIAELSSREPALTINNEEPDISIILPVYGQLGITLNCLDSLSNHKASSSVEIIVLDDASPEEFKTIRLAEIPWIRYVRRQTNFGFTKNCNYGASIANGQLLVFLNSDTRVIKGWLDELMLTFSLFPKLGLVGSKLLNADGSLQEAGGIYWKDGSAWNYGRGADPNAPEFSYARRVDYCSGASIAIPRHIWDEMNGFDEIYAPAYCEDADIAFQLREQGYATVFQPLSQVIHYEGKTHGRDLNIGIKAYQVKNSKKLFDRWQHRLKEHQEPGQNVDAARDRMARFRVLVVEHCTPMPDRDAGSFLVFNIMRLLREMGFQVTFIPEDNLHYIPNYTPMLQREGVEVMYPPFITSVEQHLAKSGERYDLVFLFRPLVVERHIESVKRYCQKAKVLFYTHDLHHLRMSREADLFNSIEGRKAADKMKEMEIKAIKAVDSTIILSTAELEIIKKELPDEKFHLLPLILDIPGTTKSYDDRKNIVFIGSYQHPPNIDAVKFFVLDVMPILRSRLPGVHFLAVGSNPPQEIQQLAGEDISITGFIEDLPSFLGQIRVSVAPLRFGAGIKGKIGTAMSVGLPTVATSLAAEGMSLTNEENILIADDPQEFAEVIVRLYENQDLWVRISKAGLDFAQKNWSVQASFKTLVDILYDLGIEVRDVYHCLTSDKIRPTVRTVLNHRRWNAGSSSDSKNCPES